MKSYSETYVFKPEVLAAFHRAQCLVEQIPDVGPSLRCHEITRAFGKLLGYPVQDGHYGTVEHSWLWVGPAEGPLHILDVYAVGRLPQVQLIDCDHVLPHQGAAYRPGDARTDIDERQVSWLVAVLSDTVVRIVENPGPPPSVQVRRINGFPR